MLPAVNELPPTAPSAPSMPVAPAPGSPAPGSPAPAEAGELVVLVDDEGTPRGVADKLSAHHGATPLHLGFSCYLFDAQGQLLVTRRALSKKVWPGVWSNSLCGHPAPGESLTDAVLRRLDFELGMGASSIQVVLPRFRYRTPAFHGVVENEICPVLVARAQENPHPNPAEVEDFAWVAWEQFVAAARGDAADTYSWWCKAQLEQLEGNPVINSYAQLDG